MADPISNATNDPTGASAGSAGLSDSLEQFTLRTHDLELGANRFAQSMTSAFAISVTGGRQFDDVLKSLALRLSDLSVRLALRPVTNALGSGGINSLFNCLFANAAPNAATYRS